MKKNKRPQAPKARNQAWAEARVMHHNMNLTVPSGKQYKRPKAGARGRDW